LPASDLGINDIMLLKNIHLTNFRNYEDFELNFELLTVLIGLNGMGKTNLLEAVYMLSAFSSYRTKNIKDLILTNKDYFRISASITGSDVDFFVDGVNSLKRIKVNGVPKRQVETLGTLITVLFSPESLDIVCGSPAERRRFMNLIIAQVDKNYASSLAGLKQVINQRNKLLYRIKQNYSKKDELEFWNDELIKYTKEIVPKRTDLVGYIKKNIGQHYKDICSKDDLLSVKYLPKASSDNIASYLATNIDEEIKQCSTLYGPHRDEVIFLLNGKPFSAGWSRGELRSATLALKMSELDYLEKVCNKEILLLLDDVFSELDEKRRNELLNMISGRQTIITTTDKDHVGKKMLDKAKIVEIGESNG
jgi:DNA replication and repair protein RecF